MIFYSITGQGNLSINISDGAFTIINNIVIF